MLIVPGKAYRKPEQNRQKKKKKTQRLMLEREGEGYKQQIII